MKKEYSFNASEYFIRTINLEDTNILVKWRSDEKLIQYFYNNTPLTKENHLNWYNNIYLKDKTQIHFIIFDKNKPIGFLNMTKIEEDSCEIGYAICELEYLGLGIASITVKKLIEFANIQFNINDFYAGIHIDNIASIKFVEKLGFSKDEKINDKFLKYKKRFNENNNIQS